MPSRTLVATELANLFRQISHPDRIRLIDELQAGGHTVQEMAANLGLSANRLSQHLAVLRSQGLVEVESSGQSRLYRLAQPELAKWIMDGIDFIAYRITRASQAEIENAKMLWCDRSAVEPP